jgi:hypothetical protein
MTETATAQNLQRSPERRVETVLLFEFFMKLASLSKPAYDLGPTPSGHRAVGEITGGWFRGDRLSGQVLTGIDYAIRRTDDTLVPDIRVVCQTDDGARFLMSYTGVIEPWSEVLKARKGEPHHPDSINWKSLVTFETSAPAYDWLNRTQVVARGAVVPGGFHYWAYELV